MSHNIHIWHHLTAPEISALAGRSVVILPIASTEQHGPQMPTGTDTILNELMQRGLQELPPKQGEFLLLPTLALGCSEHHVPFGGTYTLPPILYTQVLVTAIRSLIKQGHNRIFLLNSHGGNIPSYMTALAELATECTEQGVLLSAASYWALCDARWRAEVPSLKLPRVGHACEIEASLFLVARPDLKLPTAPEGVPLQAGIPGMSSSVGFHGMTAQGHLGFPAEASREKGEALFKIAREVLSEFFAEFSQKELPQDLRKG